MRKLKLPNFLIVGAAKSGTSSLHNYLNQHPEIFMPTYNDNGIKVKEPRFLISNLVKSRLHSGIWTFDEYKELFKEAADYKAVGEATVLYLYYYEEAIKNIKKYLSEDIKIIMILRNPIERAFSAYNFLKQRGLKEKLSFQEALKEEEYRLNNNPTMTPMVMYKAMGLYYQMVEEYMRNFSNVHVIIYDDFKESPSSVISEILFFLGIASEADIDITRQYNVGGRIWKNRWIKNIFLKENIIKRVLKNIIPIFIKDKIIPIAKFLLTKKSVPMDLETKKELVDFFKSDIEKLSVLLNRDLKHWLR